MRNRVCGSRGGAASGGRALRTMALLVVLFLGGVSCAARGAAVGSVGGGVLIELLTFTVSELIGMRTDLQSAEQVADTRRVESRRARTRATAATRSADAGRLAAEAASAAAASEEADAALAEVQARLADRLKLTGVPGEGLSAAILARIAEIERLKREQR